MDTSNISEDTPSDYKHNLNKYEFVSSMISLFDRNEIPKEYDKWTETEKYNWITENIRRPFPNLPESLIDFPLSIYSDLNWNRSAEQLPQWMDINKYRKGQQFITKNCSAILLSDMITLFYIYSFTEIAKPFLASGRSNTPFNGFKTFLSTLMRITNWYNGDPWIKGTQAYRDMQVTRAKHLKVRDKINKLSHEEIDAATTFDDPWCPDRELLLKDFAATCPFAKIGQRPFAMKQLPHKPKSINNAAMVVVQSTFVLPFLLCPEKIGVHDATDEDIEAFCHMWRYYGYILGIDDKYNFCRGTLEEMRQRARDMHKDWIIPNFSDIVPEWEHMTRCVVESANYLPAAYAPYRTMLLIITDTLNLDMKYLYSSLTYAEWFAYKFYK